MAFLLAALLGLAFGAADQQLGAASWLGPWTSTAAQVSAPWLVLPFVVGMTQERARRAMILGLVVAIAALTGYFAMTYSPMEIHPWSVERFIAGMVAITTRGWLNPLFILGGLVTGPLFGLLGQRWRVSRSWLGAALVVGVLCLEPVARWATGQLFGPVPVWAVEVGAGAAAAAVFAYALMSGRRAGSTSPP